jgi:hypothetical protein
MHGKEYAMKHTVIAVFDRAKQADDAAEALKAHGFDDSAVHVTRGSGGSDVETPPATEIESGPISGLLHRLSVLFGVEEPHVAHVEQAVRRGGSVLQVHAADERQAVAARDALVALGAVNIDDRVEEWQAAGWTASTPETATAASAPAGVFVHRREVSIGGVRVYGRTAGMAFDDFAPEFRADHATRFGAVGGGYDEFDPAYRLGHALATDSRYIGRDWAEIEIEAREEWERGHPRSAWERVREAVQHAWERVTRR